MKEDPDPLHRDQGPHLILKATKLFQTAENTLKHPVSPEDQVVVVDVSSLSGASQDSSVSHHGAANTPVR